MSAETRLFALSLAQLRRTFGSTVDVWRASAAAAGSVAAQTQAGTAVELLIVPAELFSVSMFGGAPPAMAGAREGEIAIFDSGVDIRKGDELRKIEPNGGTARYKVQNVDGWVLGELASLERPR